jgi:hypothetical protein
MHNVPPPRKQSRGVETFQPIVDGIIVEPDLDSADTYGQLPRSVADEIG